MHPSWSICSPLFANLAISQTMWSTLNSIGGFVNRNRTKILVASVIAIGVTLYLSYNTEEPEPEKAPALENTSPLRLADESTAAKAANRTRLLFKIRRQFDSTASQFLPTLRIKIVEVIDINGTVKHIKDLRARATTNKDELEARLWTEIKDSSFALLVVTVYMLSAVCTLLRIQLHILARTLQKSYELDGRDADAQLSSEMFRALIEGTYKQLFGSGLKTFADIVKQQISTTLAGWTVKDKLHVEYEELVSALEAVRRNLEADMTNVIKTIFIPAEASASDPGNGLAAVPSTTTSSTAAPLAGQASAGHAATVKNLLDQTWDLLETPAFHSVYTEAVDTCFRQVLNDLYRTVFCAEGRSPGQPSLRAPPLASLLPQIKSIATKLLPSAAAEGGVDAGTISAEIREISSGQYLDAFCIAVFDTPMR